MKTEWVTVTIEERSTASPIIPLWENLRASRWPYLLTFKHQEMQLMAIEKKIIFYNFCKTFHTIVYHLYIPDHDNSNELE